MLDFQFKKKLKAALIKYERSIPYLYQDSIGQVTIGVGHLVDMEAKAVALKLCRRSDQNPATADEKKAAWHAVKNENRHYVDVRDHKHHVYGAKHYETSSALYMKEVDIDALTEAHIVEFHRYLKRAFSRSNGYLADFDDMPDNVRLALFDMMFNMGPTRFPKNWPTFVEALKAGNWSEAALRSNRPQVNAERNAYVRSLLLSTARAPLGLPGIRPRMSPLN